MSIRLLVRSLLFLLTIGLAVTWGFSLRNYYSAFVSSPAGSLAVDLHHGTVGFIHFASPDPWSHTIQRIPDEESLSPVDESDGPMGKFEMGTWPDDTAPGTDYARYVNFPIWFPYLLLAAGVLIFARIMKRRSVTGAEKELAVAHASAGPESDRVR